MTATALLMREVEAMPEERAAQVLDFAKYLRSKQTPTEPLVREPHKVTSIKDAYGIFKGIDTHFERDEDDRI